MHSPQELLALDGGRTAPPNVLCIGVDLTWWGGGASPHSRHETILSALLSRDGPLRVRRVGLSGHPNPRGADASEPNFDAGGEVFCAALLEEIACYPAHEHVVLCLDAPLECQERPGQPPRRKSVARGASTGCKQRGAELALRTYLRSLESKSGRAWGRDLQIQAGSPIPPRVQQIVKRLGATSPGALAPYRAGSTSSPRGLVEVFPSEAIWALGLSGAFGDLDSQAVRAYKARRPRRLVRVDAREIAKRPLMGFVPVLQRGGVPSTTISAWIERIAATSIELSTATSEQVLKTKAFDDPIDSGIAFLTAVACAVGQFHEWGDETDGTIVGPCRLADITPDCQDQQ